MPPKQRAASGDAVADARAIAAACDSLGELAAALGARRVLFLTDVEGLLGDVNDPSSLISECRLPEIHGLIDGGSVDAGMLPKLKAVASAVGGGVEAAQIVDGRVPHALLMELFTEAGVGTKITA